MKKVLILLTMLFNVNILYASCEEYEELAGNIGIEEYNIYDNTGIYSKLYLYGLDDSFKLVVKNNYNNDTDYYDVNNFSEGSMYIDAKTLSASVNYEIKVYTTDSSCSNKVLKTLKGKTYKYNPYYLNNICNNYYDSIELCSPFYDIGNMSMEEFNDKVLLEIDKINNSKLGFIDYVKKYYLYIVIPFVLIGGFYTIRIVIYKRGKKKYV